METEPRNQPDRLSPTHEGSDDNQVQLRPEGSTARLAAPVVLMIVCCGLGPVLFAGVSAGIGAWFADLGTIGAATLAAFTAVVVYVFVRRVRRGGRDANN